MIGWGRRVPENALVMGDGDKTVMIANYDSSCRSLNIPLVLLLDIKKLLNVFKIQRNYAIDMVDVFHRIIPAGRRLKHYLPVNRKKVEFFDSTIIFNTKIKSGCFF